MAEYYRLNADHSVTPISDPQEWAIAFEDRDKRRVAKTKLPDGTMISTVFLGLNHAYGDGPPMIFETMIFGGKHEGDQWRYSTWDEAVAGHEHAVKLATEGLASA
jgi:hypothetical protein